MKGAVKLYIIIVLIKAKMTTNGKKKGTHDPCILIQRIVSLFKGSEKILWENDKCVCISHHESIRTLFWGQLGPEEFGET